MKKILVLAGLSGLLVSTGCETKHEKGHETAKFTAVTPLKTDTTVTREYVGQIHSIQHIELRALEKGYLQNIYVDEGRAIKKGQLMFQIMPAIYQAELRKAQAETNFAEIEYRNTRQLADSNIVSKNELALADAKLEKAKAELALARTHLGFTEIRAPFDGIMGRFNVRLGSLLDEGELLTSLSDNSKTWVYFNVPEAEYLNFVAEKKTGRLPLVKLQMANGQLFDQTGVVETIEADFNNETGNIAFRATFPNPNRVLRQGETGNILMTTSLKNALVIPQKATFEVLDKKYVFVVEKGNIVKSREITVGQELPHLYVVTGGLSESDKILVEGLRKVKNNQKVDFELKDPLKVLSELNHLHAE